MENKDHLYILWTTDNPMTAQKMVLMYAGNSLLKGWWEEVTVIIWGAADQLAATDKTIRAKVKELQEMGVHFTACKACAEGMGVAQELISLGVEVRYWGEPLTQLLKSGAALITV
jgi:hypothetical protein